MGPGALRALKILVWGLGAMIVLLTVVILAVLARPLFSGPPIVSATAAAAFDLPEGARIGGLAATADRIVVLVDRADGRQEVQVLDPATGRVTLRVAPGD